MSILAAEIVGVERQVSSFRKMPEDARAQVRLAVSRLAAMLRDYVKLGKLTGEVLHTRTGRLKRSITFRVQGDGTTSTGIVGTNVEYAAAHEFGFKGDVHQNVREYMRRNGNMSKGIVDWRRKHKMPVPMVTVHAFSRTLHMNLPERSFLRSALHDLEPGIVADLKAAIDKAVNP